MPRALACALLTLAACHGVIGSSTTGPSDGGATARADGGGHFGPPPGGEGADAAPAVGGADDAGPALVVDAADAAAAAGDRALAAVDGPAADAGGGADAAPAGGPATTITHYVTFYGWPDNDPAGAGIAYPGLHSVAGGTGTYDDPITFATDATEWPPGTRLYLPFIRRYVIMEDSCAECESDWGAGRYHIDIWLNSDGRCDSQVLACEDTLTQSAADVEVQPPRGRAVDAPPLFDPSGCACIQ